MKKSYPAIFTKEDNGFSVVFPNFSGATQGDNLEEAMANAKEFLDGILAFYIDESILIPEPEKIVEFQKNTDKQFTSFIQGAPSPYTKENR